MSSYAQLTSMLPSDSTLTAGQIAAMDHFDDTLKFCLSNWYNDKTSLVLSDNVQDLYGLALSNYFQHSLEVCVGGAVALTTVDDSNAQKTVVHMPKRNHPQPSPQVQPDMSSTTETSERNVVNLPATHVGKKKVPHVPRPMNSWMHFRDEKHKELKAENPTISVQEICKYRHNLSPCFIKLIQSQPRSALKFGATSPTSRSYPISWLLRQARKSS
jgi:hypothetical protein